MSDNQKINYPEGIIDQLRQKSLEEMTRGVPREPISRAIEDQLTRGNAIPAPLARAVAPPIQEAYRQPTLTERIETLERKVNHLMHLIGTKG